VMDWGRYRCCMFFIVIWCILLYISLSIRCASLWMSFICSLISWMPLVIIEGSSKSN